MVLDVSKELKKYLPILRKAREQGVNEAETSLRISKLLECVLGYDIFTEISKEHSIKDRYVDYAVKLNDRVVFLIEVKQAGAKLKEKHIEQACNYAANAGIEWVVLTSGGYWNLYHLSFDEGIQTDLVWSVDILEGDLKEASAKLAILHKKSVLKGEMEKYYAKFETLSPRSILQAVFQEDTLSAIRRNLKRMSGIRVDEQDLVANIKAMISKEAWEEIGDIKIKRKRKTTKPRKKKEVEAEVGAEVETEAETEEVAQPVSVEDVATDVGSEEV